MPILTPLPLVCRCGAGVGIGAGAGAAATGILVCVVVVARDLPQEWQNVESSKRLAPQKRQNILSRPLTHGGSKHHRRSVENLEVSKLHRFADFLRCRLYHDHRRVDRKLGWRPDRGRLCLRCESVQYRGLCRKRLDCRRQRKK
jgi:hypothetical protein